MHSYTTATLAAGLTVTTPYPSVTVSPGTQVSFDIAIETTNATRVNLSVSGAPASWDATLHGGGFVVGAVQTDGDEPTTVRLPCRALMACEAAVPFTAPAIRAKS